MTFPPRRAGKQHSFLRRAGRLLFLLFLPPVIAMAVYRAISTGNYMGLAALAVCGFFCILGFNAGNIRQYLPGLSAEQAAGRSLAVFVYTLLGFAALAMAGHLPKSHEYLPLEMSDLSAQQEISALDGGGKPRIMGEGSASPRESSGEKGGAQRIPPPQQPENSPEQTAPVTKMEQASVVTKIVNAQLIQVNDQELVTLIGIQVPDNLQSRATAFLAEMLQNRQVSLTVCTQRPRDDKGRTRAMVTVEGINVNLKLIEAGYSPLVITLPCSFDYTEWQKAEDLAKRQKRGIWAKHPE